MPIQLIKRYFPAALILISLTAGQAQEPPPQAATDQNNTQNAVASDESVSVEPAVTPQPQPSTTTPNQQTNTRRTNVTQRPESFPIGIPGLHHWGYFGIESSPPLGSSLDALQDGDPDTRLPSQFGQPLQIAFTQAPNIGATDIKIHFQKVGGTSTSAVNIVGKIVRRVPRRNPVLLATVQPRPGEDFLHFQFPRAIPLNSLVMQLQVIPGPAPGTEPGSSEASERLNALQGQTTPIEWADIEASGTRTPVAIRVQPSGILTLQAEPPHWIVPEKTPFRVACWQIDSTGSLSLLPLPGPVGFSSNNPEVLSILPNGRANAIKPGSSTILGVLSGPQMLHDRMQVSVPAGLPLGADVEVGWLAANPEDAGKELRTWQAALINHGPFLSGRIRVEWAYAAPGEDLFRTFEISYLASMTPGLHILEPRVGQPLLPATAKVLYTSFPVPDEPGGRIQIRIDPIEIEDPVIFNNTVSANADGKTIGLGLSPIAFSLINGIGRRPVQMEAIDECPPEFPFSAYEWARLLLPPQNGFQAILEQGANATSTGPPAPQISPGIAWSPSGERLLAHPPVGLESANPVFTGHIPASPIDIQPQWMEMNHPPISLTDPAKIADLGPLFFFPPRN